MFWKKIYPPYKEVIQSVTKIAQSEYKVSIDQSQAKLFVYSLLVSFYFPSKFLFFVFNLITFCDQNFLTMHGENKYLNVEKLCSQKRNPFCYT